MEIFTLVGKMAIEGLDKSKQQLGSLEQKAQKVQKGLKILGAAFTAVGAAGLAMVQSTKKLNAQLGVTAINLGVTTKEMRDLTLATTNVTFPINEVIASFDFLARAGIKDTEVLQRVATAFDTLGDAIGMGASQVTEVMVPAMKTFRLSAEEIASKTDMMTYMIRNSTISLEDFNTMVGYTDQEMVAAGFTIEDMAAAMIYMSDNGVEPGRVMLREWMKAVTRSKEEGIAMTEALGMTSAELETYRGKLEGATGMTQEFADVANEQYTLLDKLKQKWSELTLGASGFLEPLEPILAGMTALGPLMIFLGTSAGTATIKWIAHTVALVAYKFAAIKATFATKGLMAAVTVATGGLNLAILAIIAGVAALIAAGIALWKNWDKVVHFFEIAWINIKIIFLTGVEKILEALARFTSWIPVLGDEIEKAHIAISNMIDSEEVRKDATRAARALEITEKAMDETTEAAVELEESIAAIGEASEETNEALEKQAEAIKSLKKSYEELGATPAQIAGAVTGAGLGGGTWGVGEGAPAGMTLPAYEAAARAIRAASPGMTATESFRQVRIAGTHMEGLQEGGIAMKPMIARIAEKEPEVVAPLDKLKGMLGGIGFGGLTVNIAKMVVREPADVDRIAREIVRIVRQREGLRI